MRTAHSYLLLGCASLLGVAAGCSRRDATSAANLPPAQELPTTPPAGAAPQVRVAGRPVARVPRGDAGVPDRGASPRSADAGADGETAEAREARLRAETERSVSAALNGAQPKLKDCYDRSGATTSGAATVRLRVHRSGYVMDADAEGLSDGARSCVTNVLRGLHVPGVQTDSLTVQRTFHFQSGR
ncbi:MAG: hypothetical protein IT371_17975 [Deltaproteobacteria bacterium]|nr:hypothetical protein [Deltaproteobacteria bacterium]